MKFYRYNYEENTFDLTRDGVVGQPLRILDIKEYDPLLQKYAQKVPYIFTEHDIGYVDTHHDELETEARVSPDFNYGQVQQMDKEYLLSYNKMYRVFFDVAIVFGDLNDIFLMEWHSTAKFTNYGTIPQTHITIEKNHNPVTRNEEGELLYPISANIYFSTSMRLPEKAKIGFITNFQKKNF